jgi:hypothetical protein
VHDETGRPEPVIQAEATPEELVEQLGHGNIHVRDTAVRLLAESGCVGVVNDLEQLVLDPACRPKKRMHALWALVAGNALNNAFANKLLECPQASVRAWGVRAVGNRLSDDAQLTARCCKLASDESPDVQLQLAIAVGKFAGIDPLPVWLEILTNCGDDPLIPHIVWQNLHPHLPERAGELLASIETIDLANAPGLTAMLPKVAEKLQN